MLILKSVIQVHPVSLLIVDLEPVDGATKAFVSEVTSLLQVGAELSVVAEFAIIHGHVPVLSNFLVAGSVNNLRVGVDHVSRVLVYLSLHILLF